MSAIRSTIALVLCLFWFDVSFAKPMLVEMVPHFYEFDKIDNPNGYHWCGHTALKSVGKYITAVTKTQKNLHVTFISNSSGGYKQDKYCTKAGKHWCAKLQDLMWAAQLSQNGGYNRPKSVVRTVSSASDFFTKIKDGVNQAYPPIVPSGYLYNDAGHFWVVTGYNDTGNIATSTLYLRDVAISAPVNLNYDRTAPVQEFYRLALSEKGVVQILYVK